MIDPKECFKTHPMLHSVAGLGVGLFLVGLLPSLGGQTGLLLGVILVVASFAGHYVIK